MAVGEGETGLAVGEGDTGLGVGEGETGLTVGDGDTALGVGEGETGLGVGDGDTGLGEAAIQVVVSMFEPTTSCCEASLQAAPCSWITQLSILCIARHIGVPRRAAATIEVVLVSRRVTCSWWVANAAGVNLLGTAKDATLRAVKIQNLWWLAQRPGQVATFRYSIICWGVLAGATAGGDAVPSDLAAANRSCGNDRTIRCAGEECNRDEDERH